MDENGNGRAPARDPRDRGLVEWLRVVRDGWPALVALVAVGVVAGFLVTRSQETQYESSSAALVTAANGFLDPANADKLPAITATTVRLARMPAVLAEIGTRFAASAASPAAAQRLRALATTDWLNGHLRVQQVASSSLIDIRARASTQRRASALAAAAVRGLVATVEREVRRVQQEAGRAARGNGIRATIVSAGESKGKVSPTPVRNLVIGGDVGLFVGIVAAVALGLWRRRVRGARELADVLELPIFGRVKATRRHRPPVTTGIADVRARLIAREPSRNGNGNGVPEPARGASLLVTGPTAGSTIATVAEQLAASLALASRRTILVDSDMHDRSVSRRLDIVHYAGLANALNGATDHVRVALDAIRTGGTSDEGVQRYDAIPAGKKTPDAATTLSDYRVADILEALEEAYDYVIVAGPPVDRAAEVLALARVVDRALLVVDAGVRARRLERLHDLRADFSDTLVGAVVVR